MISLIWPFNWAYAALYLENYNIYCWIRADSNNEPSTFKVDGSAFSGNTLQRIRPHYIWVTGRIDVASVNSWLVMISWAQSHYCENDLFTFCMSVGFFIRYNQISYLSRTSRQMANALWWWLVTLTFRHLWATHNSLQDQDPLDR